MASVPKLKDLSNELTPVKTMWKEIGQQLGITEEQFQQCTHPEWFGPGELLCEALDFWLRGGTNVSPTWDSVAIALESIGEVELSKKLKDKYSFHLPSYKSRKNKVTVCQQSPMNLSAVLDLLKPLESKWHTLGVHLKIIKEILDRIEADHKQNGVQRCLTEIISYWQQNDEEPSWKKLAVAIEKVGGHNDILELIPGHVPSYAMSVAEDLESGSDGDSEEVLFDTPFLSPGCGCGECNIHKICTGVCPRPDYTKRLPILTNITGGQTHLQHSAEVFEQQTVKLCQQYGSLLLHTCKSFKKYAISTGDVAMYLLSSFPLLKQRSSEINAATDMTKLFTVVTVQACSWFNFDIIRGLINEFGSVNDHERLAEYEQHFETFARRRLPQELKHFELGTSPGMTGSKKLIIKVDREWESISIRELERLRREFAKILEIDQKNLYLADVNKGCIMLTLMVPEEIANTLSQRKLTTAQKYLLASERVLRLSCGRLKWSSVPMEDHLTDTHNMLCEGHNVGAKLLSVNNVIDLLRNFVEYLFKFLVL